MSRKIVHGLAICITWQELGINGFIIVVQHEVRRRLAHPTVKGRSYKMFSFSKYISEWASILKLWFFFEKFFHYQNVVLFWKVFSFSKCGSFLKGVFIFKMWKVLWVFFSFFPKNTIVNISFPKSCGCSCLPATTKYSKAISYIRSTPKKGINYFLLFQKHVFIFKMRFEMSFHSQNVVLLWKVFLFSKCDSFLKGVFIFKMW